MFPVTRFGCFVYDFVTNCDIYVLPILGNLPNYYLVKVVIRKEKFEKNEKKEGKLK